MDKYLENKTYNHNAPELNPKGIIPEGGTYYSYDDGEYNAGEAFPEKISNMDQLLIDGYQYVYYESMGGWCIYAMLNNVDRNKTSYPPLLESISNKPITEMMGVFQGCTNLTEAPVIPKNVKRMYATFQGCTSLTEAPAIPESVIYLDCTFNECTSLKKAPVIPSSVIDMQGTFGGCTSLTEAPVIPNGVTNMSGTFGGCTSLTEAPVIPNSVTNMNGTFEYCTNLTKVTVIPSSVKDMYLIFAECTSLTGVIEINANPEEYEYAFDCVDMTSITLTGDSTMLNEIGATGLNWTSIS